eukprot:454210-Pelagomonas_calceolata.AAC.1
MEQESSDQINSDVESSRTIWVRTQSSFGKKSTQSLSFWTVPALSATSRTQIPCRSCYFGSKRFQMRTTSLMHGGSAQVYNLSPPPSHIDFVLFSGDDQPHIKVFFTYEDETLSVRALTPGGVPHQQFPAVTPMLLF